MSASPRILQFGTTGQLGVELLRATRARGQFVHGVPRAQADFTDQSSVVRAVAEAGDIDVVINATAYTAVDKAESEVALAMAINADTVGALARACGDRGVPLIHVSTDYVYDGVKPEPYLEEDRTNPLGVYGRTKLEGENAIRASGVPHVILRTSWVYSSHGNNFVKTMLRLGREREELRVVSDQHGAPTSAAELAAAILEIANQLRHGSRSEQIGTFHFTAAGVTTWAGFAEAIFERSGRDRDELARVVPITAAEFSTVAKRPQNSRLDCGKIERVFGIKPALWEKALGGVLAELMTDERGIV